MGIHSVYSNEEIGALAKARFKEERSLQRLDGWFLIKESAASATRDSLACHLP